MVKVWIGEIVGIGAIVVSVRQIANWLDLADGIDVVAI